MAILVADELELPLRVLSIFQILKPKVLSCTFLIKREEGLTRQLRAIVQLGGENRITSVIKYKAIFLGKDE
jgi:hypothetical protein